MTYRSWERGDPLDVLIRKGEDCTHCQYLGKWRLGGELVTACDNKRAPERKRKGAPASRCELWRHEKADSGI